MSKTLLILAALVAAIPGFAAAADNPVAGFVQSVLRARVIDLSHLWDDKSPIISVNPPYKMELAATHAKTRGQFNDENQISFTSEKMEWSGQHGAPSIDAIGHIGRDGRLFGGIDAAKATENPAGIGASGIGANLGIDAFPIDSLRSRGILLDVASMVNKDMSPLPGNFEITSQHLVDAAKRQGVQVRKGDTVFIRTGWGQHFVADGKLYLGDNSPGPGVDAANWLVKQGVKIAGADTATFEQRPPVVKTPRFQLFPVHMVLIADAGVYIIENLNLEDLARAKAYEFVAVIPPLKVRGGTGSALRAFAMVPGR